jgi:hypothetical protein
MVKQRERLEQQVRAMEEEILELVRRHTITWLFTTNWFAGTKGLDPNHGGCF